MTSGPENSITILRRRILHRFKLNLFLIHSAVQTSRTSFQIAEEYTIKRPRLKKILAVPTSQTSFYVAADCTIKRPRFQNVLSSSNF